MTRPRGFGPADSCWRVFLSTGRAIVVAPDEATARDKARLLFGDTLRGLRPLHQTLDHYGRTMRRTA